MHTNDVEELGAEPVRDEREKAARIVPGWSLDHAERLLTYYEQRMTDGNHIIPEEVLIQLAEAHIHLAEARMMGRGRA